MCTLAISKYLINAHRGQRRDACRHQERKWTRTTDLVKESASSVVEFV